MLQLHLSGQQFYCLQKCVLYEGVDGNQIHANQWDVITHPCRLAKPTLKLGHGWVITSYKKLWMLLLIHTVTSDQTGPRATSLTCQLNGCVVKREPRFSDGTIRFEQQCGGVVSGEFCCGEISATEGAQRVGEDAVAIEHFQAVITARHVVFQIKAGESKLNNLKHKHEVDSMPVQIFCQYHISIEIDDPKKILSTITS